MASSKPPVFNLPFGHIHDLPPQHRLVQSHVPDEASNRKEREDGREKRLIFVGDVHGRLSTLQALLRKVKFDHRKGDHLVLVGDMITKGPDSAGVIRYAMEVGASAVRGNHEDNVLHAYKALKKEHRKKHAQTLKPTGAVEIDYSSDDAEADAHLKQKDHARAVARSLTHRQITWIANLPLILRVGKIPGATSAPWNAGEIVVVHAGLVPSLALEQQDPWAVMNMRSLMYPVLDKKTTGLAEDFEQFVVIDKDGKEDKDVMDSYDALVDSGSATTTGTETQTSKEDTPRKVPGPIKDIGIAVPSDTREGEPWSHAWNRFHNKNIALESERTVVIYGHDARAGLQANMGVSIRPHPALSHHRKKRPHHPHQKRADGDADQESNVLVNVSVSPSVELGGRSQTTKRNDTGQTNNVVVNIEIAPELETENDGETEIEVETEIEIEIETENSKSDGGNGTAKAKRDDEGYAVISKHKNKKHHRGHHHKGDKKEKGVRYAFGLDSGCGHGRELTALVLKMPDANGVVAHRVKQVPCDETHSEDDTHTGLWD